MDENRRAKLLEKSKWLWQSDSNDDLDVFNEPDKTTLVFGIFYLNKLLRNESSEIPRLHENLQKLIEPWNKFYPWNQYTGVEIDILELDNGLPYIFGTLCVEDNIEREESLMVAILHDFSSKMGPDVFVKICDTEGDFLLMECHDILTDNYEHPGGNNRLWLHEGKFKMIPDTFHPGRGLRRDEVLDFLKSSYYACVNILSIQKRLHEHMLLDFPKKELETLVSLPLKMQNEMHAHILKMNPRLIGLILKNFLDERIVLANDRSEVCPKNRELEILAPIKHCQFLSFYLSSLSIPLDNELIPIICGELVSKSLQNLIEKGTLETLELNNTDIVPVNCLQSDLVCLGLLENTFEHKVVELESFPKLSQDIGSEEEILSRLQGFFSDTANIDGINSTEKAENRDDTDSSSDEDEEVRKYFERENVDIDEEDFFEFFLTEALKVKKDNLNDYRNTEEGETLNDFDSDEEKEIMNQLDEVFGSRAQESTDHESLQQLLQALSVDGSINGPLHTIMRNLEE